MARYGPPEDVNSAQTQHAPLGRGGYPPPGPPPDELSQFPTDQFEPYHPETEFKPWYRKPVPLIGWSLVVAILIALIIYGIVQLIGENQGTGRTPHTTTPPVTSTTTTPITTTTPTPTTTVPPATTAPPATNPPVQPPRQTTQAPPPHHPHLPPLPPLPPLPSVITLPGVPTTITLPPNLP
ncbi:hypothetical protein [Mycobacterium riyadhense]|uniref:hypothetical protein n=1 Tax=Mycobacterium riyadhense TaxID=486698 RepID=UPI001950079C|nr:hypothetical protein [Mycobacterium riyadhense]